jgi:hypothetical protein
LSRRLLSRLARLEARGTATEFVSLRIGYLTTLPKNFGGERHIAILSRLRTAEGVEICQCEERLGPVPAGTEFSDCHVYFNEIDMNL